MKFHELFRLIEILINFTNKLHSTPKKLKLNYLKNEDSFTIIFLFIYFFFIGTWGFFKAVNQDFVFFTIIFYMITIVAYYFSLLTLGNVILAYNLDHDFNLKTYEYEIINNKIVEKEIPSPLLNKLRKKEKVGICELKDKQISGDCQNEEFNFSITNNDYHLNEYKTTNVLIYDPFNTVKNDLTNDGKKENSETDEQYTEDFSFQCLSLNSEINYANRPKIKTGPGGDFFKYLALKYYLIQEFYPDERIATCKYISETDFLKKVATLENVKWGSIKNQYNPMKYENLNIILKTYPRLIILLHQNNELKKYPLADNCAKKLLSE